MALKLITAPATEPVTLTEAKLQIRQDGSDEDALITGLIATVRSHVETITRRALITQTWELVLDQFPAEDEMEIPLPPLQSVTSLKYKDDAGVENTFALSNYYVDVDSLPGRLVLLTGITWPSTTLYAANAIRTRFVAGYAAAANVPAPIKQAILLLVGHYYENREAVTELAGIQLLPMAVDSLLSDYRVWSF